MKNANCFSLTGRLTSDARFFDSKNGKVARFSLAHNFVTGTPTLFVDLVMFSKTGAKDTPIPEDLLKKGTPVEVSGFLRPGKSQDGKKPAGMVLVAASCEPIAEAESA